VKTPFITLIQKEDSITDSNLINKSTKKLERVDLKSQHRQLGKDKLLQSFNRG